MPPRAQYVGIVYDYVTCEVLRIIVPDDDDALTLFHPLAPNERMTRVLARDFSLADAQAAVLRATGRMPS